MEANISLYELNRSIIEQQGELSEESVSKAFRLIKQFSKDTNNKYYMLYGREINYFTIFTKVSENWEIQDLELAVFECLANIGIPYSIELTKEQDAIEIWVKTSNEEKILTCMYLFPYDNGVVRIEG